MSSKILSDVVTSLACFSIRIHARTREWGGAGTNIFPLAFLLKLVIFEKSIKIPGKFQERGMWLLAHLPKGISGVKGVAMMKTILVVEDEKHLRTLYSQELIAEGYQVVTAHDGKEALETVKNSLIDLAILDIKLQGDNGLEVLRDVMEQNRGLKVIINTAYSSYRNDFTSWSADAYIVKSSDLEELKSKVRELVPLVAGS
jgi:CheY-like chemotaxis protein